MAGLKPVIVSKSAFNFCKFTIAAMLWVSLIWNSEILLILAFIILTASAIVKVQKAPLLFLYHITIDKIIKSEEIVLEEKSIAFAHTVGALMSGAALIIIYFVSPFPGWVIVGVLAFMKSIAAFGFCGAAKLYTCVNNPNGKCCRGGLLAKKCLKK